MPARRDPEAVLARVRGARDRVPAVLPARDRRAARGGGALEAAAKRYGCTPAQLAIAWLLARSPVMLPIPGTSKVTHLEENVGAVHVALDPKTVTELAPNAAS